MSNFFDSEIVKEELQEIRDLQNEIYGKIPTLNMFSHDEKVDHIEKLETLLEKTLKIVIIYTFYMVDL